jgi:hypothetical protein
MNGSQLSNRSAKCQAPSKLITRLKAKHPSKADQRFNNQLLHQQPSLSHEDVKSTDRKQGI